MTNGFLSRFNQIQTRLLEVKQFGVQCRHYARGQCDLGHTCHFCHFRVPRTAVQSSAVATRREVQEEADTDGADESMSREPSVVASDAAVTTTTLKWPSEGGIDDVATNKLSATEAKFRRCLAGLACRNYYCEYAETTPNHRKPCDLAEICDDPNCECLHPEMTMNCLEEFRERLAYVRSELRAAAAPRNDPSNEVLAHRELFQNPDAVSPFIRSLCLVAQFAAFEGWQVTFFVDARLPSVEAFVSMQAMEDFGATLEVSQTFAEAIVACQDEGLTVNAANVKARVDVRLKIPTYSSKIKEFFQAEMNHFGLERVPLDDRLFTVSLDIQENSPFTNEGTDDNDDETPPPPERLKNTVELDRQEQEAFLTACYAARCVISHGGTRAHSALEMAKRLVPRMRDSKVKTCLLRLVAAVTEKGFRACPTVEDLMLIDDVLCAITVHYTRLRVYLQVKVLESFGRDPQRFCRSMGYHVKQVKQFFMLE